MSRSSWKVPNTVLHLDKKNIHEANYNVVIQDRAAMITPMFIGQTVRIANGLHFVPIRITERHVGFKFGAFAFTKKRARLKK